MCGSQTVEPQAQMGKGFGSELYSQKREMILRTQAFLNLYKT